MHAHINTFGSCRPSRFWFQGLLLAVGKRSAGFADLNWYPSGLRQLLVGSPDSWFFLGKLKSEECPLAFCTAWAGREDTGNP